jgi:hypothetical protein
MAGKSSRLYNRIAPHHTSYFGRKFHHARAGNASGRPRPRVCPPNAKLPPPARPSCATRRRIATQRSGSHCVVENEKVTPLSGSQFSRANTSPRQSFCLGARSPALFDNRFGVEHAPRPATTIVLAWITRSAPPRRSFRPQSYATRPHDNRALPLSPRGEAATIVTTGVLHLISPRKSWRPSRRQTAALAIAQRLSAGMVDAPWQ